MWGVYELILIGMLFSTAFGVFALFTGNEKRIEKKYE